MFSGRVPASLEPNRLSTALARARADGTQIVDLTLSNPTRAGFDYPPDLLTPLAHARGLHYAPVPAGVEEARVAIANDFARRGSNVAAEQLVLTSSTSEAYALAFKVLCDAGDEVLIPRPSYPLFEHLTHLDAVVPVPYSLEYHGRWEIDMGSVEQALGDRTKVIVLVSPNNPTGSVVTQNELSALADLCAPRGVALVCDEVFADYELSPGETRAAGRLEHERRVLGFTLGGLSKSIGLPQVKLSWMAISGPSELTTAAKDRLELAADTYLSVSTPVQLAAAELLAAGGSLRCQIHRRVRDNDAQLRAMVADAPSLRLLAADAGWYAVLQVPAIATEEELVLSLLTETHTLVHPGYFFDFPQEAFLIISLLPPPGVLREGAARILRFFDERRA